MLPVSLIPAVDPIPVPQIWFDILLVTMFTIHILFMNTAVGTAMIALASRGKQPARDLSRQIPAILALTINFGVAPFLFLQVVYGHFNYVSSVLMGGLWLSVIGILLLAYYGLYIYDFKFNKLGNAGWFILLAALVLMLWVGFMFSNNMTLMLNLAAWPTYFTSNGAFLNLSDNTLIPRYLHHILAAPAVGGLYLALLGKQRNNDAYVTLGMRWFIRATVLNMAIGIWFLMSLPTETMLAFMGGNALGTGALLASLIGTALLLWAGMNNKPVAATVWTVVTVALMAVCRYVIRSIALSPYFETTPLPVTYDYDSLGLFLFFLVAGGAIIFYMIKLALRAGKEA